MIPFTQQLTDAWDKNDSLVCVGLDPEIERFPAHVRAMPSPIFQFNRSIIDATADLVCAYKPQFAHYAAYEAEDQLERTIRAATSRLASGSKRFQPVASMSPPASAVAGAYGE